MKRRRFIEPRRDEQLLLPPDIRDYVSQDHFAVWLVRTIGELDLSSFYRSYEVDNEAGEGRPPFDPAMVLALTIYALANRALTTRQVEALCGTDFGARYIMGNLVPDHTSIARFHRRHQVEYQLVLTQVILLCHEAGLISLENLALDSTVIKAAVGRNSNTKISELETLWEQCSNRAKDLLERVKHAEEQESARLEKELKQAQNRAAKLKRAMEFLKAKQAGQSKVSEPTSASSAEEAKEQRRTVGETIRKARIAKKLSQSQLGAMLDITRQNVSDMEAGRRPPPLKARTALADTLDVPVDDLIPAKAPRKLKRTPSSPRINLTDNDCYTTYKPTDGFNDGYLAQAATDSKSLLIVYAAISPANNDHPELQKCAESCKSVFGKLPDAATADTGYASNENFRMAKEMGLNLYCSVPRNRPNYAHASIEYEEMRAKVTSEAGKTIYNTRSVVGEPPFARIKCHFGMRRFLTRGLANVTGEWLKMALTYNLVYWFRATMKA